MELLIGCGNSRKKNITCKEIPAEWSNLITLDMDPACNPDHVHNLDNIALPFGDNTFDEIHAYEVLEHCGRQGDWRFFFDQFAEFWRILKPGGYFVGSVPMWDCEWAWADPGHTRVIAPGSLIFLSQKEYEHQVGKTAMTDYRAHYKADFDILGKDTSTDTFGFILRANK
jgi:SAM-dependent methyltransferase